MEAHPDVGLVYGPAIRATALPADLAPVGAYDVEIVPGAAFIASACETGLTPVAAATAVVRGPLQKQVGGYRAELTHSNDWEMWLRLAAHAAVGHVGALQALYRQHAVNMHIEYERSIRYLQQRRGAFDVLFDAYGNGLPDAAALRDRVRRVIASEAFWRAGRAFERGDASACREALAFAADTDASIRRSRAWRTLTVKRLLGPRVWSTLEPTVTWMRHRLPGRTGPLNNVA
jgi:hypothetical protein